MVGHGQPLQLTLVTLVATSVTSVSCNGWPWRLVEKSRKIVEKSKKIVEKSRKFVEKMVEKSRKKSVLVLVWVRLLPGAFEEGEPKPKPQPEPEPKPPRTQIGELQ